MTSTWKVVYFLPGNQRHQCQNGCVTQARQQFGPGAGAVTIVSVKEV